jgi:hypothetical protein
LPERMGRYPDSGEVGSTLPALEARGAVGRHAVQGGWPSVAPSRLILV